MDRAPALRRDLCPALAVLIGAAWVAGTVPLIGAGWSLQIALLLGAGLGLLGPATAGAGVATGLCAAAGLALGPAAAPGFAALGALALAAWVSGSTGAGERLGGLGVGALVGLAAAKGLLQADGWDDPGCAVLDTTSWRAALALAAAPLAPALLDRHVAGPGPRAAVALAASGAAGAVAWLVAPACFPPAIAPAWLAGAASMAVGIAVGAWRGRGGPSRLTSPDHTQIMRPDGLSRPLAGR